MQAQVQGAGCRVQNGTSSECMAIGPLHQGYSRLGVDVGFRRVDAGYEMAGGRVVGSQAQLVPIVDFQV